MPSQIIPKEKLSAYQRWELDSFEPTAPPAPDGPTPAEIQCIRKTAHDEGYAAGYREGQNAAREQAQRFEQLLAGLRQALADVDAEVSREILALALAVAKQVLRQALKVKPELMLPVIREALTCLPQFHQKASLYLHPDDSVLVRTQLGEQLECMGCKIVNDGRLERGGCRIESMNGQIDATVETRWRRVLLALGVSDEWLE